MKRILMVLTVALVMAALLVVIAAPAFAAVTEGPGKGNLDTLPPQASVRPDKTSIHHQAA